MIRFLILYPKPTDIDAFERHYTEVHIPLAKQLPGLRRYSVGRNVTPIRGEGTYHLVAELEWDDMDSLQRDFKSDLGRETASDVDTLSELCPGIQSMVVELTDL